MVTTAPCTVAVAVAGGLGRLDLSSAGFCAIAPSERNKMAAKVIEASFVMYIF
jgi:hypothetical protein